MGRISDIDSRGKAPRSAAWSKVVDLYFAAKRGQRRGRHDDTLLDFHGFPAAAETQCVFVVIIVVVRTGC
jgi:hypothetical protein